MALKQAEKGVLDSIQDAANMVADMLEYDLSRINSKMQNMMDKFKDECGHKVYLELDENNQVIASALDLKKNYVKTVSNPDKTLISLRAQLAGVSMDIKVLKGGVALSNELVAQGLKELQEIVKTSSTQFASVPDGDWPTYPGGDVSLENDDEGPSQQNKIENENAATTSVPQQSPETAVPGALNVPHIESPPDVQHQAPEQSLPTTEMP